MTWTDCRKVDCYCGDEVEVSEVQLPPGTRTKGQFVVVERRGTVTEIGSVDVAVDCVVSQATRNCPALTRCFPRRCVFYNDTVG